MNCRDFDRTWNDRLDARGEPPEAEGLAPGGARGDVPGLPGPRRALPDAPAGARGLGTTSGRPGRVRGPVPRTPGRRRGPPRLAGPGVACLVDPDRHGGVLGAGGRSWRIVGPTGVGEPSPDRPPRRASRRPPRSPAHRCAGRGDLGELGPGPARLGARRADRPPGLRLGVGPPAVGDVLQAGPGPSGVGGAAKRGRTRQRRRPSPLGLRPPRLRLPARDASGRRPGEGSDAPRGA